MLYTGTMMLSLASGSLQGKTTFVRPRVITRVVTRGRDRSATQGKDRSSALQMDALVWSGNKRWDMS